MHRSRIVAVLLAVAILLAPMAAVSARGNENPNGIPLYVIIEVQWDGNAAHDASWIVHGPKWNPTIDGPVLASCPIGPVGTCLAADYEFTFHGKTVQFDEVFVDTVTATPQVRHVVLSDLDGDGTYTGTLSGYHYFPWAPEPDGSYATLYFDSYDYEVTFDQAGNVTNFYYVQYEYKKL